MIRAELYRMKSFVAALLPSYVRAGGMTAKSQNRDDSTSDASASGSSL
jgi:hypothetical protein